jgi:AcrR family transcriptional regulator
MPTRVERRLCPCVPDPDMSDPSSLIESAAQGRRRAVGRGIEHVALGLFAERPLAEVTVDEIVSAADVSLRTFYRYFSTKEQVFIGLPRRGAEQIARDVLAVPASVPPFEAVERAVATADRLLADEDLDLWMAALMRSGATDRLARLALATTASALTDALATRAGLPADDPWVEMAGSATASAITVGIRRWMRHRRGDIAPHVLAALDIAGRGLRAGPGG